MKLKRILKLQEQIDTNLHKQIGEELTLSIMPYDLCMELRDPNKAVTFTFDEARKLRSVLNQLLGD